MRYIVKRREKKDKSDWSNIQPGDKIDENTTAYHGDFIIYDLLEKKVVNGRDFFDTVVDSFYGQEILMTLKRDNEELANAMTLILNTIFDND